MSMKVSLRSAIAKAKNLGSSGHGSSHWLAQRLSAILLMPLFIWALFFAISASKANGEELMALVKRPSNGAPILFLMITALYHSGLGMQVVIEDYISSICLRNILIILLKIFTATTIFFLSFAVLYFVLTHR
ncbi:MAG: succinate dehydrogenase, hydrophobic membrane anchor protein [Alphaproteobacteria bacterium]|nr:succinate dehydrogenase, hydrophobic membrane anchor protein [Alphaproteobacteria bacterium]